MAALAVDIEQLGAHFDGLGALFSLEARHAFFLDQTLVDQDRAGGKYQ
jgi:hypothetical protein